MTGSNTSIRTKTRHPADFFTYVAIYVCAILSVALLLGIIVYVFVKGIRSVNWEFLTSVTSVLKGTTGIAGNIVNTLYIIIVTMLIATPIGVGAAVYLNEYAKPGKLVSMIVLRHVRNGTRSSPALSNARYPCIMAENPIARIFVSVTPYCSFTSFFRSW